MRIAAGPPSAAATTSANTRDHDATGLKYGQKHIVIHSINDVFGLAITLVYVGCVERYTLLAQQTPFKTIHSHRGAAATRTNRCAQ